LLIQWRRSGGYDLDVPAFVKNLQADQVVSTLQEKVHARISHSQVSDPEFRDCFRKIWPIETNLFLLRVQGESEARLQLLYRGRGGPRLRGTCHRVKGWSFTRAAVKSAKELRKAVQVHECTDLIGIKTCSAQLGILAIKKPTLVGGILALITQDFESDLDRLTN
jgi:hypothetical protein